MLLASTTSTSLQTAGRTRTWVTPSQEVQAIKVSTMGPDDAPTE
jgi:hypothetical protein